MTCGRGWILYWAWGGKVAGGIANASAPQLCRAFSTSESRTSAILVANPLVSVGLTGTSLKGVEGLSNVKGFSSPEKGFVN